MLTPCSKGDHRHYPSLPTRKFIRPINRTIAISFIIYYCEPIFKNNENTHYIGYIPKKYIMCITYDNKGYNEW